MYIYIYSHTYIYMHITLLLASQRAKKAAAVARARTDYGPRARSAPPTRSPMLSLAAASRQRAGLDGRGGDTIASHARVQMEELLSLGLREALAPLGGEHTI